MEDRWRWPRRLIMVVALALGVAFVISAVKRAPAPQSGTDAATDVAIVDQVPSPGAHILHQASVGADFKPGYDGRITIDGRVIPEDQMDGAAAPGSPAYDPRYGVRPNRREHVFFTPGPDKVIDRYPTGEVQISIMFWRIADGPAASKTVSWAFFVN